MGLWTAITGRSRPKRPQLDNLFLVPSAAITFETTVGLRPTGTGSVCYRAASGHAFQEVHREAGDPAGPIADLHAVNTSLEEHGFSEGLLCTLIPFEDAKGRRIGLVYLYKQGTFYPFAPVPGGERKRDNLLEIQLRDTLRGELPMEADLGRWMALWGAPGL